MLLKKISTAAIMLSAFAAIAVFAFSSCSKEKSPEAPSNSISNEKAAAYPDESRSIAPEREEAQKEKSVEEKIKGCVEEAEKNGGRVLDAVAYDIDFDGTEEILVLYCEAVNCIAVFETWENGETVLDASFGAGTLKWTDSLELKSYEDEKEKYAYFTFHYDNGGVMKCDVIEAVKRENGEYKTEYLLSWGTLYYSDIPEPIFKEFYRIGWNQTDIGLDGDYGDISREEFLEIYKKYYDDTDDIDDKNGAENLQTNYNFTSVLENEDIEYRGIPYKELDAEEFIQLWAQSTRECNVQRLYTLSYCDCGDTENMTEEEKDGHRKSYAETLLRLELEGRLLSGCYDVKLLEIEDAPEGYYKKELSEGDELRYCITYVSRMYEDGEISYEGNETRYIALKKIGGYWKIGINQGTGFFSFEQ